MNTAITVMWCIAHKLMPELIHLDLVLVLLPFFWFLITNSLQWSVGIDREVPETYTPIGSAWQQKTKTRVFFFAYLGFEDALLRRNWVALQASRIKATYWHFQSYRNT